MKYKTLKNMSCVATALSLVGLATNSEAATVYSSKAAFDAAIASIEGFAYNENFDSVGDTQSDFGVVEPGYGYTVSFSSAISTYNGYDTLSQDADRFATMTLTFTDNVTAVGGNFFKTNAANIFVSSSLTITVVDSGNTVETFTPSSETSGSYRGFVSAPGSYITSITLSAPGGSAPVGNFNNIDNLTVIPEPASAVLFGLGALGLVARRRRI
jgi:PEP-CTERM motif